MMREIAIKRVKDNWIDEFSNLLDKVENKEFKKALSFYKENYFKGVSRFLVEPKTTGYEDLFTNNGFTDIYVNTYRNIGTSFANWYAKSIGSLLKKQDVSGYNDIWEAAFAEEGRRIAGNRVTLVSGTAKATLKKELKRFMQDPEFMAMDERRQSRILRTRFNQYSNSQAKRLIRTEATNAANQGTMRSALDIYGKNELQKEWIAALDERVRSNHAAAHGQIVDFEDKFLVGGEYLDRAGDPRGSAANVINCRCAIAPFPKQSDQLVDVLPPINPVPIIAETVKPNIRTNTSEIDFSKLTKKQLDNINKEAFEAQGIVVNSLNSKSVASKKYQRVSENINKLLKEYNVSAPENTGFGIDISMLGGGGRTLGKVQRRIKMPYRDYPKGFNDRQLTEIYFGNKTPDTYGTKQMSKFKFDRHYCLHDEDKFDLYVSTHEFAHFISVEKMQSHKKFWDEFAKLSKEYYKEIDKYKYDSWTKVLIDGRERLTKVKDLNKLNDVAISHYAHTNNNELMAEAFTEYKLNKTPRKWAIKFGTLIDKYFKK